MLAVCAAESLARKISVGLMPYRHPAMAIVLAVVYLTLFTAGEALHLLPGMGHFLETPSGICLWVGGSTEQEPLPWDNDGCPTFEMARHGLGQVLDADECEVCSFIALAASFLAIACVLTAELLSGQAAVFLPACAPLLSRKPYAARAPPCFF